MYLDYSSNSFICVGKQEHGPHLCVCNTEEKLAEVFEYILTLPSSPLNTSGKHLL